MLAKIGKSVLIGVGVGFVIGFAEEIILTASNATPETRQKVSKATTAATGAVAVATLFI